MPAALRQFELRVRVQVGSRKPYLMRDGGYGRLRLTHAKTRRRKVGQLCKLSTGRGAQVADKLKTCPTLQPQRGYPPSFIRHHISPLAAIAHPTSFISSAPA
jgi:hypothetical protein